jgi:autotransporter-associated beta strand protein
MYRIFASFCLCCAISLVAPLAAQVITIDTVPVGNPGNGNDPATGNVYGGVAYNFSIAKYDVTVGQYTAFLNAVAATDTYSLYNPSMATDLNSAGITQSGSPGNYSYSVIGSPNHPITYVDWGDAARFANWLQNGQPTGGQNLSTTEDGAYFLNGATTNTALNAVTRKAGATWVIPTENEWYKAAYHENDGPTSNYWSYPTGTNTTPTSAPPGSTPNTANFYSNGYAVTGSAGRSDSQSYLTDVGAYTASASPYGTFDQGGDVVQWNEALTTHPSGSARGLRGGGWSGSAEFLQSLFGTDGFPTLVGSNVGFRVANLSGSYWTGANSTNWADSGNWSGTVPGAISGTLNSDTAIFSQNAPNSPLSIDAGRNVRNIIFDTVGVNSLTVGAAGGQALLLSAGGVIQTTAPVVNPQIVNAPLVLEGDYAFTSNAISSSATLSFGGGITPAATSGVTTLALNGANLGDNTISGVLADNGLGQLAVTVNGKGSWILSAANTYSGGTTVSGGTLTATAAGSIGSGSLIVSAADTITSNLNLGANQTVSSLSGTLDGSGSANVNIARGVTLTLSQSGNTIFGGTLVNSGTVAKRDVGTLEFGGAPTLNDNSSLQANGGTLRFNVNSGAATVGTGVTVTVASGATLELAGFVSALTSGANRVNITNNSQQTSGGMLLVSGINQQVGAIDGTGDTLVNDGSDLTANHIVQNVLVIGATGSSPALVTIDASDALGNPLVQPSGLALPGSLMPSTPFGAGGIGFARLNCGGSNEPASLSPSNFVGSGYPSSVPEPSTLILVLVAITGLVGQEIAIRHRARRNDFRRRDQSRSRRTM